MTPPSLPETLAELNNLCQFFSSAEARLKEGKVVDMAGIDQRVSAVCKAVQDAIPEQQEQYLPELTVLIGLLGSYEMALRQLHDETTQKSEQQSSNA